MVWIVCIVICVSYCIYDRQRKNFKEEIKAVNDRVEGLNRLVNHMVDMINQTAKEARERVADIDADIPVPDSEKIQTFSP